MEALFELFLSDTEVLEVSERKASAGSPMRLGAHAQISFIKSITFLAQTFYDQIGLFCLEFFGERDPR